MVGGCFWLLTSTCCQRCSILRGDEISFVKLVLHYYIIVLHLRKKSSDLTL